MLWKYLAMEIPMAGGVGEYDAASGSTKQAEAS